ncbi:transcription factor bHLH94-like [Cornus florida]|uniref:transcription factor bHLH94-like n=1 Tax=Cornus florida TaxID=4283 RepID=UPI00289F04EE|nr:transcription factor bHLH94-like [Cornus florida]
MALEAVFFKQDPFSYDSKDFYSPSGCVGGYGFGFGFGFQEDQKVNSETMTMMEQGFNGYLDTPSSLIVQSVKVPGETISSSLEVFTDEGYFAGAGYTKSVAPVPNSCRRKRRRTKNCKNEKDVENQRMTHIAVERNRRKQMNDYLAVLRSLMPPSYAQRGDQASIVGGAINFVKELEQLLQFLEAHKQLSQQQSSNMGYSPFFTNFFHSPQYSTRSTRQNNSVADATREPVAEIEVNMADTHADIKVLTKRRPRQLLKMVTGLHSLGLTILHLNVTTVDHMVLYSFSVKVEDDCQLSTVNEIANVVHEMVDKIQKEAMSC